MTVTPCPNVISIETHFPLSVCAPASAVKADSRPVEPTDDHILMLAVRDGDLGQLGELFERHHRKLYGFFINLTGQRVLAEDLVQIVFERILKYRHTYRDEGSFTAWLYHLARKAVATHYRKRTPAVMDPDDLLDHPDETLAPDVRAEEGDDLVLLRSALAQMSAEEREIIILSRLQRLPHEAIARLQKTSVGAVKVRAHRALKALRALYHELGKETSK